MNSKYLITIAPNPESNEIRNSTSISTKSIEDLCRYVESEITQQLEIAQQINNLKCG